MQLSGLRAFILISTDVELGRLINDFADRRARGESLTVADLVAAHGDRAAALREPLALLASLSAGQDLVRRLFAIGVLTPPAHADDVAAPESADELAASASADAVRPAPDIATLGPYRIRSLVGVGGMGLVFEAHDPRLNRRVAIKLLRPESLSANGHDRFRREAEAVAKLQHPHIVSVYTAETINGADCLVMEFVAGGSLADLIRERAPLPTALVRRLFAQLLEGLAAAHDAGLIHRDIKPANLLLGSTGVPPALAGSPDFPPISSAPSCGTGFQPVSSADSFDQSRARQEADAAGQSRARQEAYPLDQSRARQEAVLGTATQAAPPDLAYTLKISDFGLVRTDAAQTLLTQSSALLGTPAYMSPEQATESHAVDHRTDLYSAGVVLFEMLTGRRPFQAAGPTAIVHQITQTDPPDPRRLHPDADPQLSAIALKLMSKTPAERFESARATLDALQSGRRVRVRRSTAEQSRSRWVIGATLATTAVLFVVMSLWRETRLRFTNVWIDETGDGLLHFRYNSTGESVVVAPSTLDLQFDHSLRDRFRCAAEFFGADSQSYIAVTLNVDSATAPGLVILAGPSSREELPRVIAQVHLGPDPASPLGRRDKWFNCAEVVGWNGTFVLPVKGEDKLTRELFVVGQARGEGCWPAIIHRLSLEDPKQPVPLGCFVNTGSAGPLHLWPEYFPARPVGRRHAIFVCAMNNKLDGWGHGGANDDNPGPGYRHPSSRYVDYVMVRSFIVLDPENMDGISPPGLPDLKRLGASEEYALEVEPAHIEAFAFINDFGGDGEGMYFPREGSEYVPVDPTKRIWPVVDSNHGGAVGPRFAGRQVELGVNNMDLQDFSRHSDHIGLTLKLDANLAILEPPVVSQRVKTVDPGFVDEVLSRWHTVKWTIDRQAMIVTPRTVRNLWKEHQAREAAP